MRLKLRLAALEPDEKDPLKIRRAWAIRSAFWALVIWPNLLVVYHLCFGLPEGIVENMLLYIGTLSSGPIGAYIWAAHKKQRHDEGAG